MEKDKNTQGKKAVRRELKMKRDEKEKIERHKNSEGDKESGRKKRLREMKKVKEREDG